MLRKATNPFNQKHKPANYCTFLVSRSHPSFFYKPHKCCTHYENNGISTSSTIRMKIRRAVSFNFLSPPLFFLFPTNQHNIKLYANDNPFLDSNPRSKNENHAESSAKKREVSCVRAGMVNFIEHGMRKMFRWCNNKTRDVWSV